ncbi:hypothetical protein HOE41_00340, partial [Candidatus Woesearchaeota archaeon]|nr:hypothetical protein [Candidatus Woesearchaeota archaeon]
RPVTRGYIRPLPTKDDGQTLENMSESPLFEWELPDDLKEDLLAASKVKGCVVGVAIETDLDLMINTDGGHIVQDNHSYVAMIAARSTSKPDHIIERHISFRPRAIEDLVVKKIAPLYDSVIDVSLERRLDDCSNASELAEEMREIVKERSKYQIKINGGQYALAMPTHLPAHEGIGHLCESIWNVPRPHLGAQDLVRKPKFQGDFPESSLTISDEPKLKLDGLYLRGTKEHDSEGYPTKKQTLIYHGQPTGNRLGSRFSYGGNLGNGICNETEAFPMPRMHLTKAEADPEGPRSLKTLCDQADTPVIVSYGDSGQVYPISSLINYSTPLARLHSTPTEDYLYKGGKLIAIKTPFTTAQLAYPLVASIIVGHEDLNCVSWAANCGKWNPGSGRADPVKTAQVGPLCLMPGTSILPLERRRGQKPYFRYIKPALRDQPRPRRKA